MATNFGHTAPTSISEQSGGPLIVRSAPLPVAEVWLAVVAAVGAAMAWSNRFIQDDAFISLRYAENWVQGNGLVFNSGERVAGYTNFLWVAIAAAAMKLGLEPEGFLLFMSCWVFFPLVVILTGALALWATGSAIYGVTAALVVALFPSFNAYATGGLETMLQAALVVLVYFLATVLPADDKPKTNAFILSLATACALLTRLDSALLLAPAWCLFGWNVLLLRHRWKVALLWVLPCAAIVGGWAYWTAEYYGSLVPNTFLAKVTLTDGWRRGNFYIHAFMRNYGLWIFAVILLWAQRGAWARRDWAVLSMMFALFLWFGYVLGVGGDFMEFRMMVPALPLALATFAIGVARQGIRWIEWSVIMTILATGFWHHLGIPFYYQKRQIETIADLDHHITSPLESWRNVGLALRRHFPEGTDVTIAVTAAGAIPYYSKLPTIDVHGLTDRYVAVKLDPIANRPGHSKVSDLEYLYDRGVNLLIAHPILRSQDQLPPKEYRFSFPELREQFWEWLDVEFFDVPLQMRLIAIPLDDRVYALAFYLNPSPAIEQKIDEGWPVWQQKELIWSDYHPNICAPLSTYMHRSAVLRSRFLGDGEILFLLKHPEEARDCFESARLAYDLSREGRHLSSWSSFWLGEIARSQGQWDESLTQFKRAIEFQKENFAAQVAVANLYRERDNCSAAKPYIESALKYAPEDEEALAAKRACEP